MNFNENNLSFPFFKSMKPWCPSIGTDFVKFPPFLYPIWRFPQTDRPAANLVESIVKCLTILLCFQQSVVLKSRKRCEIVPALMCWVYVTSTCILSRDREDTFSTVKFLSYWSQFDNFTCVALISYNSPIHSTWLEMSEVSSAPYSTPLAKWIWTILFSWFKQYLFRKVNMISFEQTFSILFCSTLTCLSLLIFIKNMLTSYWQCMPIIFLTHRPFSVILSSHIGNLSQVWVNLHQSWQTDRCNSHKLYW